MKVKSESEVAQSYPTLSDPMDWSLPGSIHGIFQARVYWSGVPLPSLKDKLETVLKKLNLRDNRYRREKKGDIHVRQIEKNIEMVDLHLLSILTLNYR